MSVSVTENALCVTDVMSLLSGLGYDSRRRDTGMTLVIDKYDQWTNPTNAALNNTGGFSRFDAA